MNNSILHILTFPKICDICNKPYLEKRNCKEVWKAKQEIKQKEVKR